MPRGDDPSRRAPSEPLIVRAAQWSAVVEDRVLKKWMALEMGKVQQAIVRAPQPLRRLVNEDEPTAPTRGGEPHVFDKDVLARLAQRLSPLARSSLRVPILVYMDHETSGDCYVADAAAIDALVQLLDRPTEPRDGKLWMSLPLARRLAQDWPTVFQFVIR